MNQITILFFALLKDLTGVQKLVLDIHDGVTAMELKKKLTLLYPNAESALDRSLVSINQEFAFNEDIIPADAEIGFFPPVSGGFGFPTICVITEGEIDLNDLLAQITTERTGAACFFSGMVRGMTQRRNPHETTSLYYEAYIPMAEAKMMQVADEIRDRWPEVEGIAIVQRIGRLLPKAPTVLIACTAAHRDTGVFEAARYGIDRLKEIVPVWKKEITKSGEEWIEGDYYPTIQD